MLCGLFNRVVDESCRSLIPSYGLGCSIIALSDKKTLALSVSRQIWPLLTYFVQRLEMNLSFGKLCPIANSAF